MASGCRPDDTEVGILSVLPEDWGCFTRPNIEEYLSLAWRPLEWEPSDRNYSVSVSHKGILIGEVYLNEIPGAVLDQAWLAFAALKAGNERMVQSMVTHTREYKRKAWTVVPLQRGLASV